MKKFCRLSKNFSLGWRLLDLLDFFFLKCAQSTDRSIKLCSFFEAHWHDARRSDYQNFHSIASPRLARALTAEQKRQQKQKDCSCFSYFIHLFRFLWNTLIVFALFVEFVPSLCSFCSFYAVFFCCIFCNLARFFFASEYHLHFNLIAIRFPLMELQCAWYFAACWQRICLF